MNNVYANITARGVKSVFNEAFAAAPSVWANHCLKINSDAPDEEHAWMGMVPQPREFLGGREFVGIRDFTYNIANKEYELTFLIDQNSIEDDRTGDIQRTIQSAAEVWAAYHDQLFTTLLEGGATYTTFTGSAMFSDTGTAIGASGTIDNNGTSVITADTAPTAAEMRIAILDMLTLLQAMKDDTGRTGYNAGSMGSLRLLCHPMYAVAATELVQSTAITIGGDSNPYFKNLFTIDLLPYHTATTYNMYMSALGTSRMPFIYQERTPLEIQVINDADSVAVNHGVQVLTRQRFRMWNGDPRKVVRHVFT